MSFEDLFIVLLPFHIQTAQSKESVCLDSLLYVI